MKPIFLALAVGAALGAASLPLRSQAPAPAATPLSGSVLEQLKTLRDRNAKLLEQQTATFRKIEELEKTSQTLKVLGRRS
jgi:hypothetical protein